MESYISIFRETVHTSCLNTLLKIFGNILNVLIVYSKEEELRGFTSNLQLSLRFSVSIFEQFLH